MPTNANTFNSRVTSETLEKRFRDVFPAQAGAELVQDLYASGVVQPIVDFTAALEGSTLPPYLSTAWDFATFYETLNGAISKNIVTNAGFWKVDLTTTFNVGHSTAPRVYLTDGITQKTVWSGSSIGAGSLSFHFAEEVFYVYLRSGDTLVAQSYTSQSMDIWVRQVATSNGDIVNPLGFTSS
jgi:hypothetical protein